MNETDKLKQLEKMLKQQDEVLTIYRNLIKLYASATTGSELWAITRPLRMSIPYEISVPSSKQFAKHLINK